MVVGVRAGWHEVVRRDQAQFQAIAIMQPSSSVGESTRETVRAGTHASYRLSTKIGVNRIGLGREKRSRTTDRRGLSGREDSAEVREVG